MKTRSLAFASLILISLLLVGQVSAINETTVDLTLGPGEKDGTYLPVLESDTVDVKVTSNIPVDVYVLSSENIIYALSDQDFEYEKKWSDETSLNVNYQVENQDDLYYIMIHNTHGSQTADVELEYKLYQEIAEELVEDAFEDACCGSTVLIGVFGLVALLAFALFVKSKKI